ncbi:flavin-dependent monooxygenase QhpG [Ruegeria sp. MALMAid1280]|uniref:flavin-dependent monooxygenase QhpG n=1 Tax=Ruegeria sp. MALMAid1280 TaxID=3411634 RepID=UPI003BA30C85
MRASHKASLFDIAIAGGGPAGTVAAILLARAGLKVALVTLCPGTDRREGLSPRVFAILQNNGLATEGVAPPSQRYAVWGAFQGGQNVEHIVSRTAFDAGLLAQARDEGVTVVDGAISAVRPGKGAIRMTAGRTIRAGLLFEARGRRAPRLAAAHHGSRDWSGPATISVAGFVDASVDAGSGSEISACENGWTWRACSDEARQWVQVVGDADAFRDVQGSRPRLTHLWAHVLGSTAEAGCLPAHPVVSACALRLNAPQLDPRCPRLGDAAVALDPLSGHGMFWAISSALMAPPMARAIFDGQCDLARDFYSHRVVDTFWRQARIARDFYATAGQTGDFWQARRTWPDQEPAHPVVTDSRFEPRVLLRDGRLCRGEVLVTTADPGGAAFVLGQEIAPLVRALRHQPLPQPAVFHQKFLPQCPASVARKLHGWLISRGIGHTAAAHS